MILKVDLIGNNLEDFYFEKIFFSFKRVYVYIAKKISNRKKWNKEWISYINDKVMPYLQIVC